MITENLSTLKIHKLTQEQYTRELEAGRVDPSALYLTPDDNGGISEEVMTERIGEAMSTAIVTSAEMLYAHVPIVSGSDDGKFLRVVDGVWSAAYIPNAEGVGF